MANQVDIQNYKYVDITVDFPRQNKGIIQKLFRLMRTRDFYVEHHRNEFYPDGLRIESLRMPFITIEWLNALLYSMNIRPTRMEFQYFHYYPDPFSEQTFTLGFTHGAQPCNSITYPVSSHELVAQDI